MVYAELEATKNEGPRALHNGGDGESERKKAKPDEDLPGMGQWYCLHCDRYFANSAVRDDHYKTKPHKKRVKLMKGDKPHCQLDAEMAAGMGAPDNGPRLRSSAAEVVIPMAMA